MNKIKNLHIVNLLLEISAIALLFFDGLYIMCHNDVKYHESFINLYSAQFYTDMNISSFWRNIFLATIIAMVLIFIIQIITKKATIISSLVSLLQCISFLLYSNQAFNASGLGFGRIKVTIVKGPMYYFYLIILIFIVLTSIIYFIYNKKNAQNPVSAHDEDSTKPCETEIDELKKFKDLLDSGIITQEEYDEKKKQLLGL